MQWGREVLPVERAPSILSFVVHERRVTRDTGRYKNGALRGTEIMKIFVFHENADQRLLTVNVHQHLFPATSVLALWAHKLNSHGNGIEVMTRIRNMAFL